MIENKKRYPAICFTKLPNSAINHSIRVSRFIHTFATMALQNSVDIKTVSSMLDHYSAGFTLDTYARVTTDAQLKAAQTMGNILSRAVCRFPLPALVGVSVCASN